MRVGVGDVETNRGRKMNRDDRAALRERFRTARRIQGLSQQQVADAAGVSLATVNNFERGVSVPQFDTLAAILAVLGIEGDEDVTKESYPEDVQNFLLMMGAYLSLLDEPTRLARIGQLVQEIVRSKPNGPSAAPN